MPKWNPKVVDFDPKCDLGRPRIDWFCHFGRFSKIRKIIDFSMSFLSTKNQLKIVGEVFQGTTVEVYRTQGGGQGGDIGGAYRRFMIGDMIGDVIWHADPVGRRILLIEWRSKVFVWVGKPSKYWSQKQIKNEAGPFLEWLEIMPKDAPWCADHFFLLNDDTKYLVRWVNNRNWS